MGFSSNFSGSVEILVEVGPSVSRVTFCVVTSACIHPHQNARIYAIQLSTPILPMSIVFAQEGTVDDLGILGGGIEPSIDPGGDRIRH